MGGTLDPFVLKYLAQRARTDRLSRLTIQALRSHLFDFARSYGNRPLDQLSVRAIERWVGELHMRLAPASVATRISSVRVFARWCVAQGIVGRDFSVGAPRVRRPRRRPRDIEADHAFAVLHVCRSERERFIVWLMFGCGLRCVECSRLDVEDFDPVAKMLHVTGKASHERLMPVPAPVVTALHAYLAAAGHASGAMLRCENDPARRLGPERISGILQRLFRDAGLKIRNYDGRSAHALRACYASDLIESGADPVVVQTAMGHASLANLAPYLRRAGDERVRAAVTARWAGLGVAFGG